MRACPSPNHGPRRDGLKPALVVVHFTAMQSFEASRDRLCDPAAEVSAHWLIAPDGHVEQLVDESQRAWHAGAGEWLGQGDVNSRSIGIELQNTGFEPFPAPQIARLEALLARILSEWSIPPQGVIAHSDMAPERKIDPGARFDWQALARQGLSVWPRASGDSAACFATEPPAFRAALRRFGYPDAPAADLLRAFRLRFRPWARGDWDGQDLALAAELARLWGNGSTDQSG